MALGSGAFTSVEAERSVSIAVAQDFQTFLRMVPNENEGAGGENTGRSFSNGSELEFEIPGDENGESSEPQGVGLNSVYEFHDLATISNQGTQPVRLSSTYNGSDLANLALVNENGILRDDPPTLNVGEGTNIGLYIDTHGSTDGTFNETLTIIGERVGGNRD
ncbi:MULTISPECIES: hypothetical protein [Halobacterium]|uniref:hypothetical protein n=1 Tax=Halobacterium TaxID=2239 RepID=UPI0012FA2738|nr:MULTISPECIES: hypothetical protein [Halobacterium]MCG1004315.1 hypothetical protein [Halobacterium noricense]